VKGVFYWPQPLSRRHATLVASSSHNPRTITISNYSPLSDRPHIPHPKIIYVEHSNICRTAAGRWLPRSTCGYVLAKSPLLAVPETRRLIIPNNILYMQYYIIIHITHAQSVENGSGEDKQMKVGSCADGKKLWTTRSTICVLTPCSSVEQDFNQTTGRYNPVTAVRTLNPTTLNRVKRLILT
jgi:hypothetical protein